MDRRLSALGIALGLASLVGSGTLRGAAASQMTAVNPSVTSCASAAFATARHYSIAFHPDGFGTADFNRDGRPDLVTGHSRVGPATTASVSVLLGDGAGGFSPALSTPFAAELVQTVAAVDLNTDGITDVILTTYDTATDIATLLTFLGNGDGTFHTPVAVPIGSGIRQPEWLETGDLDADGQVDVVLSTNGTSQFDGVVYVFRGDGAGGFVPSATYTTGPSASRLRLTDLNHDSRLDLAIVGLGTSGDPLAPRVEVRLGDGSGGFDSPIFSLATPDAHSLAAADFNGDSHPDLALTTRDKLLMLPGDGTGQFGTANELSTVPTDRLNAADVTGDGVLDLVIGGQSFVGVMTGDGAGNFGAPAYFGVRSGDADVAADFDGDGRTDLATAGTGTNHDGNVTVLLSLCGNVADLALSMTDAPDSVVTDQRARYTLQVVNNGPDVASAIVNFVVPEKMRLDYVHAPSGICAPLPGQNLSPDRVVRCAVGDLAAGSSATASIGLWADAGGPQPIHAAAVTSVVDPSPSNNTVSDTTLVLVPGGRNMSIMAAPGGAALSWSGGEPQAGYVIGRAAGSVATRIPAHGMLPANATSYVDNTAAAGTTNCYQVAPMTADGKGLAVSEVVCVVPDTASPPAALSDFRLRLEISRVTLTWGAFGGQTEYVIQQYSSSGNVMHRIDGAATGTTLSIGVPTCYVLIPVNGTTPLANSATLCAVPHRGTLPPS